MSQQDARRRTAVVTGSSRGIGRATVELLTSQGVRVVGADLTGAELDVDLATSDGRAALEAGVRDLCPDGIDVVVANAGVLTEDELTIQVNYFGAVETLERLRPMLRPEAPRAVVVASRSVLKPVWEDLVEACLAGDEGRALALIRRDPDRGHLLYGSSKRAIARWIRRNATRPEWAGAGIALNAVGPGAVSTEMIAQRDPAEQERLAVQRPMPLGGMATAREIAAVIGFLADPSNSKISGQLIFIDGGGEALMGPEDIWQAMLP